MTSPSVPVVAFDASWADSNATGAPQVAACLLEVLRGRTDIKVVPFMMRSATDVPRAVRTMRSADVTFVPGQIAGFRADISRLASRSLVVYVLDGIALARPEYFKSVASHRAALRSTRRLLSACSLIAYLSIAAEQQIAGLGIGGDIASSVIYPGVDHFPDRERSVGARDVVVIGTAFPHKARVDAIRAFLQLAPEEQSVLHLVGREPAIGSTVPAEHAIIQRAYDPARIRSHAAVTTKQLDAILSSCRACLVAAREEGFGLVPFELAKRGIVPLVHPCPASVEVLPSECLVDFDNPPAVAERLRRFLQDDHMTVAVCAAVNRRAQSFRWSLSSAAFAGAFELAIRRR